MDGDGESDQSNSSSVASEDNMDDLEEMEQEVGSNDEEEQGCQPGYRSESESEESEISENGENLGSDSNSSGNLERKYMLDNRTIAAAKKSRNLRTKIYTDLIHAGQGFEDKDGINGFDLQDTLTENAIKGHQLGAIKTACSSDMYNSILHTNMCTKMLKYQSEKIGDAKLFKANKYIASLKQFGDKAYKKLSNIYETSITVPVAVILIGAIETGTNDIENKKDKKATPIRARRKRVFDEKLSQQTQHEEIGSQDSRRGQATPGGKTTNHAEAVSSNIFKVLRRKSKHRAHPFNLFEFALNKESMGQTIQNLFYTGFLIRDGYASLTQNETQEENDANLLIKPDNPPSKHGQGQDIPRNQTIVSFNARLYRDMLKAAEGTTDIPPSEMEHSPVDDGVRVRSKK